MAGGESFTISLFGADLSASHAVEALGRAADHTARQLAGLGVTGVKLGGGLLAGVQGAATLGQLLTQVGAGAGVLAPAVLTAGQALGTFKLVSEEARAQLANLQPQFDGIKTSAAEAFRPGFASALDTFATNLPVVREGVRSTAAVFGELAQKVAGVFSGPAFRADLAAMMDTNTEATRRLGNAGISMAGAFWDVAVAARDVWQNFTGLVEVGAHQVAAWVEAKRESGELEAAIRRGANAIGDIVSSIFNFAMGIKALFSGVSDDNANLTSSLADAAAAFRRWAEDVGSSKVAEVFDRIRQAGATAFDGIQIGIDAFLAGWAGLPGPDDPVLGMITDFGEQARQAWDVVEGKLLPALRGLADTFVNDLLPPLVDISTEVRGTLLDALGRFADLVGDKVVPFLRDDFAPVVRDIILPAVREFAEFVRDKVLPALERMAGIIVDNLGSALTRLREKIEENRPQLELLWEVVKKVASVIIDALVWALERVAPAFTAVFDVIGLVIDVIGLLVQAAGDLAVQLLSLALTAIDVFSTIFNKAADMVSAILGVWGLLPGPLGAPFDAARAKVEEFRTGVNGSMAGAEQRIREARDTINAALSGIVDRTVTISVVGVVAASAYEALRVAQAGSAAVAAIPRRAGGGPVAAGGLYLVGERGPELVRMPAAGHVYDAAQSARMAGAPTPWGGGGGPVNVNLTINAPNAITLDRRVLEMAAPYLRDAIAADADSNGRRTGL